MTRSLGRFAGYCKSWFFLKEKIGSSFSSFCLQDLNLQEAETIALSILKQVMEEKVCLAPGSCIHVMLLFHLLFFFLEVLFRILCTVHLYFTQILICNFRWPQTMLILQKWLQLTISTLLLKWRPSSAGYKRTLYSLLSNIFLPQVYVPGYCNACYCFSFFHLLGEKAGTSCTAAWNFNHVTSIYVSLFVLSCPCGSYKVHQRL